MEKALKVAQYIILNYPLREKYSITRLFKLINIVDVKSMIKYEKPVSDIQDRYGTKEGVLDFKEALERSSIFEVGKRENWLGVPVSTVDVKSRSDVNNLSEREKELIDKVMEMSHHMTYNQLLLNF